MRSHKHVTYCAVPVAGERRCLIRIKDVYAFADTIIRKLNTLVAQLIVLAYITGVNNCAVHKPSKNSRLTRTPTVHYATYIKTVYTV